MHKKTLAAAAALLALLSPGISFGQDIESAGDTLSLKEAVVTSLKIERLIDDNTSEDYWYDVSVFTCQELINSFSDIEWQQLSEKVNSYSDEKKYVLLSV